MVSCVGEGKRVWIIVSSIIKWAFHHARQSLERAHLGLSRQDFSILWQGKSGMTWKEVFPKIKLLLIKVRKPA